MLRVHECMSVCWAVPGGVALTRANLWLVMRWLNLSLWGKKGVKDVLVASVCLWPIVSLPQMHLLRDYGRSAVSKRHLHVAGGAEHIWQFWKASVILRHTRVYQAPSHVSDPFIRP